MKTTAANVATIVASGLLLAAGAFGAHLLVESRTEAPTPSQAGPSGYDWPQSQQEYNNRSWRALNKPGYPVHQNADNLEGPYQQTPLNQLY